jgi:hypothetical protein
MKVAIVQTSIKKNERRKPESHRVHLEKSIR